MKWIEKEIPVKPKLKVDCDDIWDFLYDTIRKGKPFPVTTDEALEPVVRRFVARAID